MNDEELLPQSLPSNQELQNILTTYFNESDLRDLCFQLDIDYEDLAGTIKGDKSRELILYAKRHDRSQELLEHVLQLRPHVGLNIRRAAAQRLDPDDPLLNELNSLVEQFRAYHEHLREWKELHNHLDETLNTMSAYTAQVNMSKNNQESLDLGSLMLQWRPAYRRLKRTLFWAINEVTYINKHKFGGLGEDWAFQLQAIGEALQAYLTDWQHQEERGKRQQNEGWRKLLNYSRIDNEYRFRLQDRTSELDDTLRDIMYKSDKELRKTAEELYQLSREALWGQT